MLRRMYAAFGARDVEAIAGFTHPDVDWPNAWEGGRLRGHADVLAYWRRQFGQIDPRVTPRRSPSATTAGSPSGCTRSSARSRARCSPTGGWSTSTRCATGLVERMDVEDD
jgi:hypothetical protein